MGLYAYVLLWLSFMAGIVVHAFRGFDDDRETTSRVFFITLYVMQGIITFATGDGTVLLSTLVILVVASMLTGILASNLDRRLGYQGRWATAALSVFAASILTTGAIRINFPTYREGQTTVCLDRIMNRRDVWLDVPRPMTALLRQEPIITFK